ncbi:hypothetical protein [Dactylosporangium sp. NPDC050588]
MSTTCGTSSVAFSTATRPSPASATTSMPPPSCSSARSPARINA